MIVIFQDYHRQKYEIEIVPTDTILYAKMKVEQVSGIPTDQQRLIFSGKQLEDNRTFIDYNIFESALIHICLRLRGA